MDTLKRFFGRFAGLTTGYFLMLIVMPVLAVMAGCAKAKPRRIPITGAVTSKGQPVSPGEVTFVSKATGVASVAMLDMEGRFVIQEGLPAGRYVVSVAPPSPKEAAGAPRTMPVTEGSGIPTKYRSDTTSPLSADVSETNHEFVFRMTEG